MFMKKRVFAKATSAVVVIAMSAMASSCGGDDAAKQAQQQGQQQAPSLAVITVQKSDALNQKSFPAKIEGKTDIAIRPQVTGFITKVHVDEGQHVRKGQTLFTLDQVQFQAAVDQAQAAVNSAQTAVNTAKMDADTKRKLLDKNIISSYDYQLSENQLTSARAALAQAQAALTTARKNLSYTVVTAPSDGVVGAIPNREGSLASPSSAQPLTTVSDNSQVYAYFSLNEKDLLQLSDNGTRSLDQAIKSLPKVQLQLADGTIYPFEGTVATVSGVINSSTGAASARALFDNPSGMLRSGNTGSVILPVQSDDVVVIPQKATFEIQDKKFVFVVGEGNVLATRPVEVLQQSDGQSYVVLSGLEPGETIVTEGVGTMSVREGVTINPVKAAEK